MKEEARLDIAYLEEMAGKDPATRLELLHLLAEELRSKPARMRESWEKQDLPALQRLSHHYKSTLPFAGCAPLVEANRQLNECLKLQPQNPEIPKLLLHIEKDSAVILQQLEILIRKAPPNS